MKARTREEFIVVIADELMASGRFEDYVKASIWATRVYGKCFPEPIVELKQFESDFGEALENSSVYGVEPKSMHKIIIHHDLMQMFKSFLTLGHT